MLDNRIRQLLLDARDRCRKAGMKAEFSFHREKSSLIRLGNSSVALSTSEQLTRLDVQVTDGRRTGSYSLTADVSSREVLDDAIERAKASCAAALPKDYDPIFCTVQQSFDDSTGFDPALESLSAEAKTTLCTEVVKELKPRGKYDFSGSWSTGSTEMYVTSTANDNEAYRRLTDGKLVVVLKEQDKKWELSAERTQKAAGTFTAADIIAEFTARLPVYEKNAGYKTAIGRQRVLFAGQAVAELVALSVWGGFFGRGFEEKRTFTANLKFGDKLFADGISIVDDPANPDCFGMPFDFNGMRRSRFVLVENGVFRGVMYDSGTAAKYGRKPTGHDGPNDVGLLAGSSPSGIAAGLNLAGDALFIPHLHYIHMPDPTKGMFTGSSRFNAMRIEKGVLTAPLFSTRVTDEIPSVLNHVVAISSRTVPVNVSGTYDRRAPDAISVPEYVLCDEVRINDVADSF
ncbi:MAG: metallopeptidase TldD-related protein [bacterium]